LPHVLMVGATAPSHILPGVALMRELVRRGHRVSYAVGARLAGLVEPAGVEVIPCTTILPDEWAAWTGDMIAAMRLFLDEGIAVLPQVTAALDGDPPDLVLHDIGGHAGPVAAHRWGVPAVQLSTAMVAWEGYEDDMADSIAAMRAAPGADEFYARFAGWLAEHGVTRKPDDVMGRPERGIVLIPRALQPNADRVRETFRFAGPCIDEPRLTGWDPPAEGKPILYMSFGTAFNDRPEAYRAAVDAFAADWHLVLSVGRRAGTAGLDGAEVHRSLPQPAVLEHADVFITHAGMGSAAESLWFGVPTVAVPQAVDQFANAATLAGLGVSRTLSNDELTAETLTAAVAEVRTPEVGERVAELSAQVRAQGGPQRAADAVEALLYGRAA
jgi:MGT family glycosyltransferase